MRTFLYSLLALLVAASYLPAQSASDTPSKTEKTEKADKKEKKEKKKSANAVGTALKKLKFSGAKPNGKAQFYIFLHSASYCPPCREEMPHIAKEYSKMKQSGVELVMFSHDSDEGSTKAWLKSEKAKFPMAMLNANNEKKLEKVPGYSNYSKDNGIPQAIIVDAEGNLITKGHGAIVKEWAKYTLEKTNNNNNDASSEDE